MKFKMGNSGMNSKPVDKKQMGSKNTKSFPDLNKDGKITQADILKGRGVIKNGSKSMKVDEKMCGSKGMKYQAGSNSMKATPDSTNYFKKKLIEESFKKPRGRYSTFNGENSKIDRKINKLGEDIDRQELKGKPGYDANGYPLKKGVKKSSGVSGDFANGTKNIKFKKKPMMKRADGSTSQRGLYDNIRANKGSGKKPTPEMLKQEKKIKFGK